LSAHPPAIPEVSSAALIRTLGIVAAVCGVLIVVAYEATLPVVTANRQLALERAVLKVIPKSVSAREFRLDSAGHLGPDRQAGGTPVYAAYDAKGLLAGVAIEGAARGYADMVRVLYGYEAACQCIVGFAVLQTRETPGIGDKISRDRPFLKNFEALDARLNAEGSALAHPIIAVRHGSKSEAWQVDVISGATVTSRAVARAVNDSAQQVLPRLVPQIEQLKGETHDAAR
jgi:electron transport complex protein RnfG